MLKNIFFKNLLINTVFKVASSVNYIIPKKDNKILLYANEGFRDNIYYLYKYLIDNGYNKKYEIICSSNDYKKFLNKNLPNVRFVGIKKGMLNYFTSKSIFYCFGRIPIIPAKNQVAIQMWHGTSFKGFDKTMQKTNSFKNQFYTHVFASSEFFRPIVEKKFSCIPGAVYICGHPRTDCFYNKEKLYKFNEYKKVIMWMPTFRKSKNLGYTDANTDNLVPFFKKEELKELDLLAQEKNILIIIKLHPMQDVDTADCPSFKNIKLYTHSTFSQKYDLYELLKQTDALITDYSSVFYDYLLLDRPIGFTEDDLKEYSSNRGFAIENADDFKPGMRISSKEDFYNFIINTANNIDDYKEKRAKINKLSNQFQDGKNCERALKAANIKF